MVLVGNPEGMRPHGNFFFKLEDNIKTDLEGILLWRGLG